MVSFLRLVYLISDKIADTVKKISLRVHHAYSIPLNVTAIHAGEICTSMS